MNGKSNKWILKEGAEADGNGITVHDSLDTIEKEIVRADGNSNYMVVMKYIENPLLKDYHKMDMRMWVLVTDWNPLTVWSYEECYFRVAYSKYDLEINDIASHITNHVVYEQNREKDEDNVNDDGDNLISLSDFKEVVN